MPNNSLSPVENSWWFISAPSSPVDEAWWCISPSSSPMHYELENKKIKPSLKFKIPAKSAKFCGKMTLKLKCYRRSPRILPKDGFLNRAMVIKNK